MFNDILTEVQPFLIEAVVTVAAIYISRLTGGAVAKETLHSALQTGVEEVLDMLDDGRITREEVIQRAVAYAKTSSPGAIKRLKAPETVLQSLARAKLNKIIAGVAK